LAIFFAEAVGDEAVDAFARIDDITVTSELATSALQRGQHDTQQKLQFEGKGTVSDALIEELQGYLTFDRRRQSSHSSPQKACFFVAAINSSAA
jgi:hypothetical protein